MTFPHLAKSLAAALTFVLAAFVVGCEGPTDDGSDETGEASSELTAYTLKGKCQDGGGVWVNRQCQMPSDPCTSSYVNIQDACNHSFPGSEGSFNKCRITLSSGEVVYKTPSWGCPSTCSVCQQPSGLPALGG